MKKFLSVVMGLMVVFTLFPISAFAAGSEEIVITEGTSNFLTDQEAFDGDVINFRALTDGSVSVEISDSTPGYYMEYYEGSNWVSDYSGEGSAIVTLDVTAGMIYELIISTYDVVEEIQTAGVITYKIKSAVVTTELGSDEPEKPSDEYGASEADPIEMDYFHSMHIDAGQTVWFSYANDDGQAKMLRMNGRTDYTVVYQGNTLPVDQDGYVNYLMDESERYLFSVTNNGTYQVYFSIEFTKPAVYVNTGLKVVLGDNDLTLSGDAQYSLYEFAPSQTGEYLFTVASGVIGNWGMVHNPLDSTAQKGSTLTWLCTSVGQSVLVGIADTAQTTLNVKRTADYVAPVEVPWQYYEFTYDFTYEIPFDAPIVDIDVTDGIEDVAVLDEKGFYRYGGLTGPIMAADLSNVEVNILDAYTYGQLRAYVYDEKGNVVSRIDYNDAMYEYALYGLAPLTKELATMIKQVGDTQSWWNSNGFVFKGEAPSSEESAWMTFCSYISGTERPGYTGGGNTVTGSDSHTKPSGGQSGSPGTGDVAYVAAAITMVLSAACLVVLISKKKYFYL